MTPRFQNILILVGLIAVAGIGGYLFIQNGDVSLQTESINQQVAVETSVFLKKLNELKTIQLDGSMFIDDRFTTLVDFSVPITPKLIGKSNPFSPY